MPDDNTEPLTIDLTDNPISRVQSRMVPSRAMCPTETVEPHLAQARQMVQQAQQAAQQTSQQGGGGFFSGLFGVYLILKL